MFTVYNDSESLPVQWDDIAGSNIYLKKKSLNYIQKVNPCGQKYHIDIDKGIILVTYKLKLDLFTFIKHLVVKFPVNIIGIPLSVSKNGYSYTEKENIKNLTKYIKSLKGFYILLNSEDSIKLAKGNTLPTYKLDIKWNSFQKYLKDLRSGYRYRIKKALKKFTDVKVGVLDDNNLFNEEMYQLYLKVYNNSNEKLEKLSRDFFKTFPSKILQFKIDDEIIAFIQLKENNNELIFLFGGFNHKLNKQYDLYINILLEIIKYGIDNRFKSIDLGQTAGETKSKVGAKQYKKNMYVYHSNPVINSILNLLVDKFSYNYYNIKHNVFKEENDAGSSS